MIESIMPKLMVASIAMVLSNGFKLQPPPPLPPPARLQGEISNGIDEWGAGANDQDVFYDVIYDDLEECPVKGNAVPNSGFYGSIFKAVLVNSHAECLITCHRDSQCRSVNVQTYEYRLDADSGEKQYLCQLNEFNQYDSPLLLIERPGVVYYEDIRCDKKINPTVASLKQRILEATEGKYGVGQAESDNKFKLNRLLMLEKIVKLFQKQSHID